MALDSKNRPHVVTFKSPAPRRPVILEHNPPADIRKSLVFVHYWRDDDGRWRGGEPIEPGAPVRRPDVVFDRRDTMYFYWATPEGFRCLQACADDGWRNWREYALTEPAFIGADASKHDRARWRDKGILSFTAKPKAGGFAILDLILPED
jgi:hypothetical protein